MGAAERASVRYHQKQTSTSASRVCWKPTGLSYFLLKTCVISKRNVSKCIFCWLNLKTSPSCRSPPAFSCEVLAVSRSRKAPCPVFAPNRGSVPFAMDVSAQEQAVLPNHACCGRRMLPTFPPEPGYQRQPEHLERIKTSEKPPVPRVDSPIKQICWEPN